MESLIVTIMRLQIEMDETGQMLKLRSSHAWERITGVFPVFIQRWAASWVTSRGAVLHLGADACDVRSVQAPRSKSKMYKYKYTSGWLHGKFAKFTVSEHFLTTNRDSSPCESLTSYGPVCYMRPDPKLHPKP